MTDVKVPRLLRVREAAEVTGIERWRLYALLKCGEGPPFLRIGRTLRIPEDALVQWIKAQTLIADHSEEGEE